MSATFDFRAQQARTRSTSTFLVAFFLVLAATVSFAVGLLAAALLSSGENMSTGGTAWPEIDPAVVAIAAGLTLVMVVGAALIRVVSFSGDGAKVARALGGEEVTEDTWNLSKRRYLNIVEEMAIASGLPRPRAFVIMHEPGINAFAAGGDHEHAAVGVTHGALAKLTRPELAGVVAHELAHVSNRDSRLNIHLMGMVYGLNALYVLGRGIFRSSAIASRRHRGRSQAPMLLIGLMLIILGTLGALAGRILQSAVSRQRESLADATGVQFTRNPLGLANALKKIGATTAGSRVNGTHAEEARHMFFATAIGPFGGLFATHPPLVERIRALDPAFDPETDPIWAKDDKTILRETRRDLVANPWE